ncbi:hypothetical protein BRC93_06645 [Halobacteriales archaeon QS_5_70_15]|nr:MAG: hypothetical protein BRC93_06645 [Halobacteriales archaeon QS_5_70_15]
MGYECPVCAAPQADARHLANHVAFTAVLGDEAHEAWLDEHAPGGADAGEAELAPRVAEHAPEGEFPQVFEDTAAGLEESAPTEPPEERSGALFDDEGVEGVHDRRRGHDHDHQHGHGVPLDPDRAGHADHGDRTSHLAGPGTDSDELDEGTREVLEEAREMTREMLADEGEGEDDGSDDDRDGTAGAGGETGGEARERTD